MQMMVFDWAKAARLIMTHQADYAEAGLAGNWEWTVGCIYADGQPYFEGRPFLASVHYTPQLLIAGTFHDCFAMENERPEWNERTVWPPEALAALGLPATVAGQSGTPAA